MRIPLSLNCYWLAGRYSGVLQDNLTLCSACGDGRNYEELEPSIGLLAKYYLFRVVWMRNWNFLKSWSRWQRDVLSSGRILLALGRTGRRKWRVRNILLPFASQPTKYFATDVSFSIQKQYTCIDRFKVKLSCRRWGDALTAEFTTIQTYSPEDIERLAVQFQTLLVSAINNPETAIAQLEILSPVERQQLLVNNTQTDYPNTSAYISCSSIRRTPWSSGRCQSTRPPPANAGGPKQLWHCALSAPWKWSLACWGFSKQVELTSP